jgi:Na+/H+ antiporter NhaA
MAFVALAIGGIAFGAADQFLGTLHATSTLGWWTVSVSLLSAPWLILPFCAGWTQRQPQRAMVAGLTVTLSALVGYFVMTLSPLEGVHVTSSGVWALVGSNQLNVVGGLVAGPVFGWLGYCWHTRRSWLAAASVTGALCFEPLVVVAVGRGAGRSLVVWSVEVVVGVAAGLWFWSVARRHRHVLSGS